MDQKRKGTMASLFALSGETPGKWYAAMGASLMGILLEAFPYVSIYFIVREVLQATREQVAINRAVMLIWTGLTIAMLAISIICTLAGGYAAHKITYRLIYSVRKRLLVHLGKLPMGFFSSTSTGEIQKQMEHGMEKIEQLAAHSLPNLIGAGPLLLALLVTMFILNIWLALVVLAVAAIGMLIQGRVMSSQINRQRVIEISARMGTMNKWFNEYSKGISVVKIFGGSNRNFEKLEQSICGYRDFLLEFTKNTSVPFSAFKVLMLSILTFVLPAAAVLIKIYGGDLHLVLTILMFLIVTPSLYAPLLELMRLGVEVQEAAYAVQQIEDVLAIKPLHNVSNSKMPDSFEVTFEAVSFSYQDASDPLRRLALEDISFRAGAGQITALVGPSGGGKSTAGQLVCRFFDVDQGAIKIGGIDIREIAVTKLMDAVAFVFQDTYLFGGTVADNITMNRPVDEVQLIAAAKAARCHEFIEKLPQGYQTVIGDGGQHLSGGEAQRIAIARAILKNSPIVVLDEATAFTDADNEVVIQEALKTLLRGKTVIMIAHRLATIQEADQILVLKDGRLIQQGTHAELVISAGVYRRLWNIQNDIREWTLKKGRQDGEEE